MTFQTPSVSAVKRRCDIVNCKVSGNRIVKELKKMTESTGKYFTTGEFADLCNVKKQTLFHYDEIGLLTPELKNDKGYRFYTYQQYEVYSVIELLKNLDTPLKEIKAFLTNKNPAELTALLKRKAADLEQKRTELARSQRIIETLIQQTEAALATDYGQIRLDFLPAKPLYLSKCITGCSDQEFLKALSDFSKSINQLGLNTGYPIGAITPKVSIHDDYLNYSHLYIQAETSRTDLPIKLREAGLFVTAYHIGSEETIHETVEKTTSFIEDQKLKIKGKAFSEYLLDEISVSGIDNYVTRIQIEVEK